MLSAHDDVSRIEFIRERFGDGLAQYVKKKNTGGRGNEKGGAYENYFAVFKIAMLASSVFEDKIDIFLSSQIPCFVDDLIIDIPARKHRENFQLKSSRQLSWDNGTHPLCEDFKNQHTLNQLEGIESSKVILVVSDDGIHKALLDRKPYILNDFGEVSLFFHDDRLAALFDANPDFLTAVRRLCISENPGMEMVEAVAKLLLGAWVSETKDHMPLANFVLKAKSLYPSLIRSWGPVLDVKPQVKKILNSIEGFNYTLERGFFHWNYLDGLESGCLAYDCNAPKFTKFQDVIERQQPTTFDDLEGMLI